MPNPFTPDPLVLSQIRPMRWSDIPRVSHLHAQAMGNSLWARLGESFLQEVYKGLLCTNEALGFVYEMDGSISGLFGSTNTSTMMRSAFKQRGIQIGFGVLKGIRSTSVLKTLLETPKYFQSSDSGTPDMAESLFCSFTPKLRGRRVAGHINKVLFDTLLEIGHSKVKITTETDNIGANRQLKSWGFDNQGTFHFYGKEMALYVLDLEESERVHASRLASALNTLNFQSSVPDTV